jgi:hypothetical protein
MQFFGALDSEMMKSVNFFLRELNHFNEQIELAFYCVLEMEAILTIENAQKRDKRLREVIVFIFT